MKHSNHDKGPSNELSLSRRLLARFIAFWVRWWSRTWFVHREGVEFSPSTEARSAAIYAFWHGEQFMMIPIHANKRVIGMASHSSDGALLARVIGLLGYGVIRGSSSRGGSEALRHCVSMLKAGQSVGLAVDGPRGPRHTPHHGAAVMAVRSRRPIVCVKATAWPRIRLKSWDRFEIPLPFAKLHIRYSEIRPDSDEGWEVEKLHEALRNCLKDER